MEFLKVLGCVQRFFVIGCMRLGRADYKTLLSDEWTYHSSPVCFIVIIQNKYVLKSRFYKTLCTY